MRQVVASEVKNKGKIIKPSSVETWSLTGGGRLQESNHRGSLPTRGPDTFIQGR